MFFSIFGQSRILNYPPVAWRSHMWSCATFAVSALPQNELNHAPVAKAISGHIFNTVVVGKRSKTISIEDV